MPHVSFIIQCYITLKLTAAFNEVTRWFLLGEKLECTARRWIHPNLHRILVILPEKSLAVTQKGQSF
jgi:hypothetical protein